MQDTATASQLSSLRKTLEETENRLQEALSNEGLARRDCQRQLEEAKAVNIGSLRYVSFVLNCMKWQSVCTT